MLLHGTIGAGSIATTMTDRTGKGWLSGGTNQRASFAEFETWFGDLSRRRRRRIEALGEEAAAESAGARLLPESHGASMESQLRAGVAAYLTQEDPFCLVRLSDSELALLGGGYLPPTTPADIDWYRFRGGLRPEAIELRPTFLEAVAGAELLGLQQNWKPITESSATLLTMLGHRLPMPNGVEVHLPYRLLVDGTLFRSLAGKSVALVGWLGPRLAEAWASRPFREAYAAWGPVDEVEIAGAVPTRPRTEGGATGDYEDVLRALDRLEYDVALLSCGVVAKPLAWKIRSDAGRTALDVGFVFNALLGDRERANRPVLKDVAWPG